MTMTMVIIITSLSNVSLIAAKVSHEPVWQRGRKWSPEDGEFTTPHQLVPPLGATPAHVKNIRGTLWVRGCVRVTQVCLILVNFDHYAARLVILPKLIISRHSVTPSGESHGFATSILTNIGEFTGSIQQIQGCHYYSQNRDLLGL